MSAQDNAAMARKLYDTFSRGDLDGCLAMATDDIEVVLTPFDQTFRGHTGVINAFAFGADGKTLASASADTTVLTWDLGAALATTRYVSVSSLVGCATLAALAFVLHGPSAVAFAAAGTALLVLWKHRGNLERIARGTENRLGARP